MAEAWAGEQLSWARRDEAGAETLLTAGARLLTSEAGVSVEAVPGSATLTVARVWLQQEGEYRCYRGNIAHNNYIQHTLEITGGSTGTLHPALLHCHLQICTRHSKHLRQFILSERTRQRGKLTVSYVQ